MEQRVRHRDEEEVHREQIEEPGNQREGVDAGTDAADEARRLQLSQRAKAARRQLREIGRELLLRRVIEQVQVVNDREVVPSQAEPELALLVGAHDAVVGVVEDDLEARAADPRRRGEPRRIGRRP